MKVGIQSAAGASVAYLSTQPVSYQTYKPPFALPYTHKLQKCDVGTCHTFFFLLCFALNTQAEAINMLMDLRAKISTQEDFAEIAQEHSDCGSARSGGDLGEFGEGQMMKVRCNL